jgi:hypothetical protein
MASASKNSPKSEASGFVRKNIMFGITRRRTQGKWILSIRPGGWTGMRRKKGLRVRLATVDNLQIADQGFEPLFHMYDKRVVVKY